MTALDDVSLTVAAGEILGIVGPNGSGKTTLFNVISGFYRPHGGTIRLSGRLISGARPNQVSRLGVARTFQHLRLFGNLTVTENMLVCAGPHPHLVVLAVPVLAGRDLAVRPSAEAARGRAARRLRTGPVLRALPGMLPYGIQRRLELARAIASAPRLLLLDEPAAGLNGEERAQLATIVRSVRDSGVTVVLDRAQHGPGDVAVRADHRA